MENRGANLGELSDGGLDGPVERLDEIRRDKEAGAVEAVRAVNANDVTRVLLDVAGADGVEQLHCLGAGSLAMALAIQLDVLAVLSLHLNCRPIVVSILVTVSLTLFANQTDSIARVGC